MSQRVAVTGASGFIGSHLARRLLEVGCHVTAFVRPTSDLWRIADVLDQLDVVRADLGDRESDDLEARLSNVHIVFHLAAAGVDPQRDDSMSILTTNVMGTLRILQAAKAANVDRFIYCGSCFEYGPGTSHSEDVLPAPGTEYGASKAAAWVLVHTFGRRYGLSTVALRPFTLYGPFESMHRLIPYTIVRALANGTLELTTGDQTRDFVFVEDAVDAFLRASCDPEAIGGTFNVCTGLATSVREVVSTIIELTGSTAVLRFGARPCRVPELGSLSGDPSKAERGLRWRTQTPLREGLQKTIRWFREHRFTYPVYSGG